jgi:hypothetical protein
LLETLDRIRSTTGEYNFAGQYQQALALASASFQREIVEARLREPQRCRKLP